jgi:hypothetical protein
MINFNFPFKVVIFTPSIASDFKVLFDYLTDRPAIQVSSVYVELVVAYQSSKYGKRKGGKLFFWFDTHGEAQAFADWYNSRPLITRHPVYTCLVEDVVPEWRAVIPRPTTVDQFHKLMFLPSYYPAETLVTTTGVKATRERYVKQKAEGTPVNLSEYDREFVYYSHSQTFLRSFAALFDGSITRFR